jgi:enoyl-CoA hydratase/carnithine racemase
VGQPAANGAIIRAAGGSRGAVVLRIEDVERVRVVTLDRPEALNAFNEALYDATAEALVDAAVATDVAVVVITGAEGRAFSAGTDVVEMAARTSGEVENGRYGFPGMVDVLAAFPKPLICAVNGLALGIGATIIGFADLALMSTAARVRCPFTDLAVAPEAASSFTFPQLLGRQRATWMLMSSEWFSGADCVEMGLAWKLCEPDELMPEAMAAATVLARKSIASLVESKRTIVAAQRDAVDAARARENAAFQKLLGAPASLEAFAALGARREPDFVSVDAANPVDLSEYEALRRT